MDLEKIIKKRADVNTEETVKKLPIDLKDKRILIGGGIIGGLFLVVLFGKMFGGGGEVIQVQQGVGTKEVKAIVDESTKPLAEKLQEQEQINKQLLDMLKKQQENGEQKQEEKQEEKKEEKKEGKKEEPSSPLSSLFPAPEPAQSQPQPLPTPQPAPQPTSAIPSPTLPEPEKEPPKPKLNHKSIGTVKDDKDSSSSSSSSSNSSNSNANIEKELGLNDDRPMYLFPPDENSQSASTSSSNGSNVKKKKSVYIPAGSMSYGTLMYSFTAPADGMFPPVVIEISKSAITANHWKVPIEKCFLLVKAQYDLATERALLGGNDSIMSCVLRNGYVIEKKVNVAIGEEVNGNVQMGLSGTEKWLTGEDFAKLATLTTAQGMAAGLQQSLIQQSMTTYGSTITAIKNNGEYAILNGINNTFAKFYDFWMKKYDKKTPAIYVSAPRVVFITFVNGVDLNVSDKDLRF